ncbi:MAG: rRNA maturation RNAse YbeY, partial [Clostridia bacterium]|nr:rRNA maturation RNAse YbeY [Clostridia bacterium]
MAELKVFYRNESGVPVARGIIADIKRCVRAAVEHENKDASGFEVYITVSTADTVRSLNAEYRGIDKVTDVLSFPMDDFDITDG